MKALLACLLIVAVVKATIGATPDELSPQQNTTAQPTTEAPSTTNSPAKSSEDATDKSTTESLRNNVEDVVTPKPDVTEQQAASSQTSEGNNVAGSNVTTETQKTNNKSDNGSPETSEGTAKETIIVYNKVPSPNKPEMLLVNEEDTPIDLSQYGISESDWIAMTQADGQPDIGFSEYYEHPSQPHKPAGDEMSEYYEHLSQLHKPTADEMVEGERPLEHEDHESIPHGDYPHANSGESQIDHSSSPGNNSTEDDMLWSAMDHWIDEALSAENPDWSNLLAAVVARERAALEEARRNGGDGDEDNQNGGYDTQKTEGGVSQNVENGNDEKKGSEAEKVDGNSKKETQDVNDEGMSVETEPWGDVRGAAPPPSSKRRRHRPRHGCRTETYDFIIVGGGPAGCVLANRLSEVRHWRVLLLEAGKEEVPIMNIPFLLGQFQKSEANWGYTTVPQNSACYGLHGHRCDYPQGRALGGSSVINYMFNIRGNRLDYDTWAALGNPGWNYESVLPYFRKVENMQIPELRNSSYHGTDGNIYVDYSPHQSQLSKHIVRAHVENGAQYIDYNGASQVGVSRMQMTTRDGSRWSAARGYINPVIDRPNLTIRTESFVTRLLIDDGSLDGKGGPRANGVHYVRKGKRSCEAFATREVIVAGGAVNSPKLLMLSGIGPRGHLETYDIKVVKDLLVGYNLQDHVGFPMLHVRFHKNISPSALEVMTDPRTYAEFMINHEGPLTTPGGFETVAWSELKGTHHYEPQWPPVELLHESIASMSVPLNAALFRIPPRTYKAVLAPLLKGTTWMALPIVMRPKSRGRVRLASADPYKAPYIDPRPLSHPNDADILMAGIKEIIKLLDTPSMEVLGAYLHDKPVPACRKIPFASDAYWRCAIRRFALTLFHPVGTCKMGAPHDVTAVVTPDLKVRGVDGLRVADSSIMPRLISGHTQMATYMIAERAADIIKTEYKEPVTTPGIDVTNLFYQYYDDSEHNAEHYESVDESDEEEYNSYQDNVDPHKGEDFAEDNVYHKPSVSRKPVPSKPHGHHEGEEYHYHDSELKPVTNYSELHHYGSYVYQTTHQKPIIDEYDKAHEKPHVYTTGHKNPLPHKPGYQPETHHHYELNEENHQLNKPYGSFTSKPHIVKPHYVNKPNIKPQSYMHDRKPQSKPVITYYGSHHPESQEYNYGYDGHNSNSHGVHDYTGQHQNSVGCDAPEDHSHDSTHDQHSHDNHHHAGQTGSLNYNNNPEHSLGFYADSIPTYKHENSYGKDEHGHVQENISNEEYENQEETNDSHSEYQISHEYNHGQDDKFEIDDEFENYSPEHPTSLEYF